MLEQYNGFEFYLDTEKAQKHYFFNAHVTRGCFRPHELEYFYHRPIALYLQHKLQQPTSVSKLPKEIRYICFDHKIQQENYFVWIFSVIVDEGLHELYKLSNIKLYYRMIPPEEEFLEEEPIPVHVVDH